MLRSSLRTAAGFLASAVVIVHSASARAEENWPRWRGPAGTGASSDANLPVRWANDDIAWRVELEGRGQSSPIVWNDRIFLTSALDDGRSRVVMCLDRGTGKVLWRHTAWTGEPEETHAMNPWASATCATDGKCVAAFFGNGGLHCYDLEGKLLWSRDLGVFEGPWGTAASPIIVDDLVIQNCDADNRAFLIAVDKRTGETVWQTPREAYRGWSTPILVDVGGQRELVLNGHLGLNAYDPATGKDLWFCKGDRGRGTPTVVPAGDLFIAVGGLAGEMFSVRQGGRGDVTESHGAWRAMRKGGRDLPSPIIVGDYLLVVNLRPGTGTCYLASSGKELWTTRLGGNFSASPIAANGLVYVLSELGETIVFRLGPAPDIVARNHVNNSDEEIFRASPAAHRGQILLRSDRALYCIGAAKAS